MADNDASAERIIARIRRSPPNLPYGDGRWHTPASKRPNIETVVEPEFSVGPVVETEETKKTKQGILDLLKRPWFSRP